MVDNVTSFELMPPACFSPISLRLRIIQVPRTSNMITEANDNISEKCPSLEFVFKVSQMYAGKYFRLILTGDISHVMRLPV